MWEIYTKVPNSIHIQPCQYWNRLSELHIIAFTDTPLARLLFIISQVHYTSLISWLMVQLSRLLPLLPFLPLDNPCQHMKEHFFKFFSLFVKLFPDAQTREDDTIAVHVSRHHLLLNFHSLLFWFGFILFYLFFCYFILDLELGSRIRSKLEDGVEVEIRLC